MSQALLSLLQLSDPGLPIGGYAHSAGLETYVQAGVVKDRKTAEAFVRELLSKNIYYTDAALVACAYTAAAAGDQVALLKWDALCEAVKLPMEIRQASRKLGMRLLKIFGGMRGAMMGGMDGEGGGAGLVGGVRVVRMGEADFADQGKGGVNGENGAGAAESGGKAQAAKAIGEYDRSVQGKRTPGHYCIAFGSCAAALGIGLREALTGYYYNAAAGMVTNCVKLIPMGQQDGQELLYSLQSLIGELVEGTLEPDPDMIGFCSTGLDIRCMQHERLYSRLYMS